MVQTAKLMTERFLTSGKGTCLNPIAINLKNPRLHIAIKIQDSEPLLTNNLYITSEDESALTPKKVTLGINFDTKS
jgi:hypothetical protein